MVGDPLHPPEDGRLRRVRSRVVGDPEGAAEDARVGDAGRVRNGDDPLRRAAPELVERHRLERVDDPVSVPILDARRVSLRVEVEGDAVGAGRRPCPRRIGRARHAQIEVDARGLLPVREALDEALLEAVEGAVPVHELHREPVGGEPKRRPEAGEGREGERPAVPGRRLGRPLEAVVGEVSDRREPAAGREEGRPAKERVPAREVHELAQPGACLLALVLVVALEPERDRRAFGRLPIQTATDAIPRDRREDRCAAERVRRTVPGTERRQSGT